jgi:MscS family membrane protein
MGRRRYRRLRTEFNVAFSTPPERVDKFCNSLKELFRRNPQVLPEVNRASFNDISATGLTILVYVYIKANDYSEELAVRHGLMVDILELADNIGIRFTNTAVAVPASS